MQHIRVIGSILAVIAMIATGVAFVVPTPPDAQVVFPASTAPEASSVGGSASTAEAALPAGAAILPASPPAHIISTGRPAAHWDLERSAAQSSAARMEPVESPLQTGSIGDASSELGTDSGDGVRRERAQPASGEAGPRSGQRTPARSVADRQWTGSFFDRQ